MQLVQPKPSFSLKRLLNNDVMAIAHEQIDSDRV
jgi:hypothetical protein